MHLRALKYLIVPASACMITLLVPANCWSQQLEHEADLVFQANAGGETPFWLQHNRYDRVAETSGARLGVFYKGWRTVRKRSGRSDVDLFWGLEAHARTDESLADRPLQQLWLGARRGNFQLKAGLWQETVGIVEHELSAGPTIWSPNSRPMPKIKAGLTDFTSIPWTGGWFSVKAGLSHGWFEGGREVQDFWLHEKYVYAKLGKEGYPEIYGGLIHMGQWGGYDTNRFGQIPEGFRDYWRIFFGQEGGADSPPGFQTNVFGNSLGSWQGGLLWRGDRWEVLFNKETIFEDGTGFKLRTPEDGVQGVNLRFFHSGRPAGSPAGGSGSSNRMLPAGPSAAVPALSGGSTLLAGRAVATLFTYEFWHTKSQSGPGAPDPPPGFEGDRDADGNPFGGQDNYFNHSVYRNGWSYHGRTIGVPFITYDPARGRMTNNRMLGHHIGLLHQREKAWARATWSWTRNYGTFEHPFEEPLNQQYLLAGFGYSLEPLIGTPVSMQFEFGLDWGEFQGSRSGVLLSLTYRFL